MGGGPDGNACESTGWPFPAYSGLFPAYFPRSSGLGAGRSRAGSKVMTAFTETVVEAAALAWLESLGWQVRNGAEIAPDEPAAESSA